MLKVLCIKIFFLCGASLKLFVFNAVAMFQQQTTRKNNTVNMGANTSVNPSPAPAYTDQPPVEPAQPHSQVSTSSSTKPSVSPDILESRDSNDCESASHPKEVVKTHADLLAQVKELNSK